MRMIANVTAIALSDCECRLHIREATCVDMCDENFSSFCPMASQVASLTATSAPEQRTDPVGLLFPYDLFLDLLEMSGRKMDQLSGVGPSC